MIRTLDRYILRELWRTFAITLTVITFVFFVGTMFRLMRDELTYWQILRSLPFAIPFTLPYTLPMAFLVALTLTYGRLVADGEVLALQSCGVPPRETAAPAIAFAVALSMGSLALQADYLPYCHRRKTEIQRAALEQMLALGDGGPWSRTFPQYGFDIYIQHHKGPALTGVVIHRDLGGNPMTITSEEGQVAVVADGTSPAHLELSLQTVTITSFGRAASQHGPVRARAGSCVQEIPTGRGRITESDFSNSELRRIAAHPIAEFGQAGVAVELVSRAATATAPLVFLLLGLPLTFALQARNRLIPFVAGVAAVSLFYFAPMLLGRTLAERAGGWPGWVFLGHATGLLAGTCLVPLARRLSGLSLGRAAGTTPDPSPTIGAAVVVSPVAPVTSMPSPAARAPGAAPRSPPRSFLPGLPLGILDRWILRRFFFNYAVFIGAVLLVFVVTDSLQKLDRFLDEKRPLVAVLFEYYSALLPDIYYMLAPFLTLAATLWVVFDLRRHNELAPLMAAGVGPRRVCAPMFAAAALFAGVMFVDREVVIPSFAEGRRASSRIARYDELYLTPIPDRLGGVLAARSYVPKTRELRSATYTRLDPRGREVFTIYGATAVSAGEEGWLFHDGIVVKPQPTSDGDRDLIEAIPPEGRVIATDVEVLDVECAIEKATYLSTAQMERQYKRIPGFRYLGVQLARRYSYPLSGVVLLILGLPFVLAGDRTAALLGLLACIGLSVLYFVATLFCEDLGSRTGGPDPLLAVWIPVILFGVPGAIAFLRRVP